MISKAVGGVPPAATSRRDPQAEAASCPPPPPGSSSQRIPHPVPLPLRTQQVPGLHVIAENSPCSLPFVFTAAHLVGLMQLLLFLKYLASALHNQPWLEEQKLDKKRRGKQAAERDSVAARSSVFCVYLETLSQTIQLLLSSFKHHMNLTVFT